MAEKRGEVHLARVFGDRALVVSYDAGHEADVRRMLEAISVAEGYPHLPVYDAMAKVQGVGVSSISVMPADEVHPSYLVCSPDK